MAVNLLDNMTTFMQQGVMEGTDTDAIFNTGDATIGPMNHVMNLQVMRFAASGVLAVLIALFNGT